MQMAGQSSTNFHNGFGQHCCGSDMDVLLNGEHQAFFSRQGKASFDTCVLSASARRAGALFLMGRGHSRGCGGMKMCMSSD